MDMVARIKRLEGPMAVIEVAAGGGGGCGRCDEPGGCRSGLLTQMFRKSGSEFLVPNDICARVGDQVFVRLGDGKLARWSLVAYVLPVFAVLFGAALGASAAGDSFSRDGGAIGGALLGLLFAVWLNAFRFGSKSKRRGLQLVRMGNDFPKCKSEGRHEP